MRIPFPTVVALATFLASAAPAQKHPHFDDKGTLPWHTTLATAKDAARGADKLIFVEISAQT